ncbi:hypothetical protein ElyMa_003620100 [Elysia marginata]|uniref:Uncharacterized protein n=1 Tax=Elysia marginata TaxID=1093978 RepID=A0AAV4ESP7_9GAST|nr:hypothetical protein ElyMa_003620100 [Elysia marginata]
MPDTWRISCQYQFQSPWFDSDGDRTHTSRSLSECFIARPHSRLRDKGRRRKKPKENKEDKVKQQDRSGPVMQGNAEYRKKWRKLAPKALKAPERTTSSPRDR